MPNYLNIPPSKKRIVAPNGNDLGRGQLHAAKYLKKVKTLILTIFSNQTCTVVFLAGKIDGAT